MPTAKTQTCCLTPKGRGAIASIAIQGPESLQSIDQCFRSVSGKLISEASVGQILFGSWHAPFSESSVCEDLVVCRTAEQSAEIHCHGGVMAPKTIIDHLATLGCEPVEEETWISHRSGRIVGEALTALAHAPTERTALILLEQSRGHLENEIQSISQLAIHESAVAAQRISELLSTAQYGIHLVEYWNVVFAGPPNVGKSSLMNALVGFRRSIVYDQPGTTRDLVSIETAFDGWPVRLTDTAGIHDSQFELESQGIELAKQQADEADLVINVSDATHKTNGEQISVESPQIFVRNKSDLLSTPPQSDGQFIYTSAISETGIPELINAIVQKLVPRKYSPTTPTVFSQQQESRLKQAYSSLLSGDIDSARKGLTSLLDPGQLDS